MPSVLSKITVTITALAAITNGGAGGGGGPLVNIVEGCGRNGEGYFNNNQITGSGDNGIDNTNNSVGDTRYGDSHTGGSKNFVRNDGDTTLVAGDSSDQIMSVNQGGDHFGYTEGSSSRHEANSEVHDSSQVHDVDCSDNSDNRVQYAPQPPIQWGGYNAPGAMGGYPGYQNFGGMQGGGYGPPNYGYNPQQYGFNPQQGGYQQGYPQGQPMNQNYHQGGYQQGYPQGQPMNQNVNQGGNQQGYPQGQPMNQNGNPGVSTREGYQQGYPQGQPNNYYDQTGRRLEKDQAGKEVTVDFICVRVNEIVRRLPIDMLSAIVSEPTESNKVAVNKAAQRVIDECQYDTEWSWSMNQCVFYVKAALAMDYEELEESWLAAYGDLSEQMRGCGRVVTAVNADFHRRIEAGEVEMMRTKAIVGHEEEDKIETHYDSFYLVEKPEDSITRRLAQAVGLASVATGTLLGHICRNFNPATGDIVPLVNV